jgi:non-specific serine/threonine protein kinase
MIQGEIVFPVAPLPVPDASDPNLLLTEFPGLALLVDRAGAVVPGFMVTPDNRSAVIRLCNSLEGIPLAIELAAARLRVLPAVDLAERLEDRFQVLTQGSRTAPERHQTLEAAIDYSHALCSDMERVLWARASVFVGGFTLEAAEAVCADSALPTKAILDALAGLIEKSVMVREDHDAGARYRMLDTLRAYGEARLQDSGDGETRRRHRDWYLALVEDASAEWFGPAQTTWAARLRAEHANLRIALEYCLAHRDDAQAGFRMAGLPWFLWIARGLLSEGRMWLERLLSLPTDATHDRAWAFGTAAYIAVTQGDGDAAASFADECLRLGHQLQDDEVIAYATHLLGLTRLLGADLRDALAPLADARERYARLSLPDDYVTALLLELALAHLLLDELDSAEELLSDARTQCIEAQESWLYSEALWASGFVDLLRGNLEAADAALRESLSIKRYFHDSQGMAFALDILAWTRIARHDAASGALLLGGASGRWQAIGAQPSGFAALTSRRERFARLARDAIGNDTFDAAFATGAEKPLDEVLAEALRERPPAAPGTRRTSWTGVLTPREREVADLVADGLANKEIAETLVISPRTAETHVENILTKLGFTSRTQIATWVAEQRMST